MRRGPLCSRRSVVPRLVRLACRQVHPRVQLTEITSGTPVPARRCGEVLSRWGEREHVEILFLTDRRYRLHEGRAFDGSFAEASQALLSALSHLPRPPVGERRFDGRTFAVMHRARGLGDGR